ncbi:hypothetical protein BC834DRAFT_902544 [Gloeopeniophorella convolvens]|nr:hypothetical protein BC834DRAFT_902544 [Gloeopeniophorella convolvens]
MDATDIGLNKQLRTEVLLLASTMGDAIKSGQEACYQWALTFDATLAMFEEEAGMSHEDREICDAQQAAIRVIGPRATPEWLHSAPRVLGLEHSQRLCAEQEHEKELASLRSKTGEQHGGTGSMAAAPRQPSSTGESGSCQDSGGIRGTPSKQEALKQFYGELRRLRQGREAKTLTTDAYKVQVAILLRELRAVVPDLPSSISELSSWDGSSDSSTSSPHAASPLPAPPAARSALPTATMPPMPSTSSTPAAASTTAPAPAPVAQPALAAPAPQPARAPRDDAVFQGGSDRTPPPSYLESLNPALLPHPIPSTSQQRPSERLPAGPSRKRARDSREAELRLDYDEDEVIVISSESDSVVVISSDSESTTIEGTITSVSDPCEGCNDPSVPIKCIIVRSARQQGCVCCRLNHEHCTLIDKRRPGKTRVRRKIALSTPGTNRRAPAAKRPPARAKGEGSQRTTKRARVLKSDAGALPSQGNPGANPAPMRVPRSSSARTPAHGATTSTPSLRFGTADFSGTEFDAVAEAGAALPRLLRHDIIQATLEKQRPLSRSHGRWQTVMNWLTQLVVDQEAAVERARARLDAARVNRPNAGNSTPAVPVGAAAANGQRRQSAQAARARDPRRLVLYVD